MSEAKRLLERIYRERDFFGGMDKRIEQAAAEDAEDFAAYEAAVEALERLTANAGYVIEHVSYPALLVAVMNARAALARLRDSVPA